MTEANGLASTYVAEMGSLDDRFRATLTETSDDVAHSECFDREQRAEVYTILETLKANAETHRAMVKLLHSKLREDAASA